MTPSPDSFNDIAWAIQLALAAQRAVAVAHRHPVRCHYAGSDRRFDLLPTRGSFGDADHSHTGSWSQVIVPEAVLLN
jgi:hypothetical protein